MAGFWGGFAAAWTSIFIASLACGLQLAYQEHHPQTGYPAWAASTL